MGSSRDAPTFGLIAGLAAIAAALALFAPADPAGAQSASAAKKGKAYSVITTAETTLSRQDDPVRVEAYCPAGPYRPFGGGVVTNPAVTRSGAGVYPVSSERLGAQQGWHVSVVELGTSEPVKVTTQAFCVRGFKGPLQTLHKTFSVRPGETKTMTARCPGRKKIVSAGYLSTQLFNTMGVYVTESRRVDDKTWSVTGTAVATGSGGEITTLAYCFKSKKPALEERVGLPANVLASPSPYGDSRATSAAPACPANHPLAIGGFSAPGDGKVRIFDDGATPDGAVQASAVSYRGAGSVTAYSYCLLSKGR